MKIVGANVHVVTLAGGLGGRLNATTNPVIAEYPIAKPICPVGNLRIIDFTLRALAKAGLKDWHFAVYHLPETIQRIVGTGRIYGNDVKVNYLRDSDSEALDTAGSVAKIVKEHGWDRDPQNVVVVPSADIIHNVPLEKIIEEHIENRERHKALATIVVNRVPWESVERFGTVRLEGMPERKDFKDDHAFEDAVSAWIIDNQAASQKIQEFREKQPRKRNEISSPGEIFERTCLSNLNNSSIYILSASLFPDLFQCLTRKRSTEALFPDSYKNGNQSPFSDWGRHVFPWLIRKGLPVYAYILPENYYWRDAGLGEELLQVNKDVLDGKIDTGLSNTDFWQAEPWGWKGNNVYINPSVKLSEKHKSIVAENVVIEEEASIAHSVIGANTIIKAGAKIHGSVIFAKPLDRKEPNFIGKNTIMIDSIFTGGETAPDSKLEKHLYYNPKYKVAMDSLNKETKID